MITTLTMNPSLDCTIELDAMLQRGGVQRAKSQTSQAAGKGVNVARALVAGGLRAMALLPGDPHDPVIQGLNDDGLPHLALPIGQPLRSNLTLAEADGTTTKINAPGPTLDAAHQQALIDAVFEAAKTSSWLVLAGSLPPSVAPGFYAQLVTEIRARCGARAPRIAVDTSGAPLRALLSGGPPGVPDLVKPNAEELAELSGEGSEALFEANPELAGRAARQLVAAGAGAVLATLGSQGAVLATAAGCWYATHEPVAARSTVGAGDSAQAGYLLTAVAGGSPADCLRQAVAHGSAAVALPGSSIPHPKDTNPRAVTVAALPTPPLTEGKP